MKRYFLKSMWVIVVILAILIGYIPVDYLLNGVNTGYLELKSQALLNSKTWYFFLYMHIISGGITILIGWVQFNQTMQKKWTNLHRTIGKIYLISALFCSLSGIYVGFFATGGWVAAAGFITVACIYFYTSIQGFFHIKKGQILSHQNFMTYSYAVCLSAVTLRLATPTAYVLGLDYISSYQIIAWAAWIPNLAIAYWINKNREVNSQILKTSKLT
ncbi:DUF2306 domain-containing protein [Cognataquiflexum aquatile]|uniref:DUF2306 domain-containing protein n=1 Tax=Cognataquiflexum aquatile TaxID=2249427 RepID=UPI001300A72E|nr:DUF2306 domain-containing protein [Cognataquiflexum aquatile]